MACVETTAETERNGIRQRVWEEADACWRVVNDDPSIGGLVFNLLSIAGFHMAEALAIPCVCTSTCILPYACPPSFPSLFRQEHPRLYKCLQDAEKDPAHVGWAEVEHWMWRIFLDDHGAWREKLGLPPCPFLDQEGAVRLPPPIPLLYGITELLVERPSHWPVSAQLCGIWPSLEDVHPEMNDSYPPPDALRWLHHPNEKDALWRCPIVVVSFGSMDSLGCEDASVQPLLSLPHATRFWECLVSAIRELPIPVHVILMVGRDRSSLWQAWCQRRTEDDLEDKEAQGRGRRVTAVCGYVSHGWLLRHVRVMIHHGGAGTIASCARMGVAQIVCPFLFDQFDWAKYISGKGCGVALRPLSSPLFHKDELITALRMCLGSTIRSHCTNLANALAREKYGSTRVLEGIKAWGCRGVN
eukprot:TRINITY_DN24984_c0_g1_i1.p1 TRINITY_DN24984_c0_g1~~TRINITY_DN24984_c0_g1_i1.p1  ORF type:complete len:483 (-),score=70.42 TRINITY_DN24984_c0_g1_i1:6-1247(-)